MRGRYPLKCSYAKVRKRRLHLAKLHNAADESQIEANPPTMGGVRRTPALDEMTPPSVVSVWMSKPKAAFTPLAP